LQSNNGTALLYDIKVIDVYSEWSRGKIPVLLPSSSVTDIHYPVISSKATKLTTPTPLKVTKLFNPNWKRREIRILTKSAKSIYLLIKGITKGKDGELTEFTKYLNV